MLRLLGGSILQLITVDLIPPLRTEFISLNLFSLNVAIVFRYIEPVGVISWRI